MARLNQPLGGFGRFGGMPVPGVSGGPAPLPPPRVGYGTDRMGVLGAPAPTLPPITQPTLQGGMADVTRAVGNQNYQQNRLYQGGGSRVGGGLGPPTQPGTLPPIAGGGLKSSLRNPLGGATRSSGLPPGQGDGPATAEPDPSAIGLPPLQTAGFRPASRGFGLRPVGPPRVGGTEGGGSGAGDLGNNPAGYPSSGWSPGTIGGGRPIGSPNTNPDEMKGIWGGPPARLQTQYDAQGNRIYGAANVLASMARNGFPGLDPNVYSQAWADEKTNWAKKSLADAYAAGELDPQAKRDYENYLNYGPGKNPYEISTDYNQQGEYVGMGGEGGGFGPGGYDPGDQGLMNAGYDPMPTVGWALGESGDWGQAGLDYRNWHRKNFGMNPDPVDDQGNFWPDTTPAEKAAWEAYCAECAAQGKQPSEAEFRQRQGG